MHRLLLSLGLAAMEACWLIPWVVLLGLWLDASRPSQLLLSPGAVLAVVLLGLVSTQILGRRAARSRGVRLGLVGLGVVVALVAVRLEHYPAAAGLEWLGLLVSALAVMLGQARAPALAFGLGLFLWWRGVRLGRQAASYSDVESAFRWGVGLLLLFVLVMAISTRPSLLPALEGQTTPWVVGFFFVSLLTLALGRLESLRTRSRALKVNSQWFSVLVGVAALVILVALLVGQLLSFDLLIVATRPLFDLLGQILLLLIYAIVIPLAYVVEFLIYLILSLINPSPNRQPPQPYDPAQVDNMLQRFLSDVVPPEVFVVLKALGAVLLLGVALVLIARAARRWRSSSLDADAVGEERDSVWDPGRFKQALIAWLRALFGRVSRPAMLPASQSAIGLGGTSTPHVASVRELYRQLLGLGESVGARRLAVTTPLEHLASLQESLEPGAEVAHLTDAYVEVRYAEQLASPAEVAALESELQRVHPRDAPA